MKRFLLWICAAVLTLSSASAASDGILKKAGKFNTPYEGLPGLTQKANKKSSANIKTRPVKGTANPRLKKAASALTGNSLVSLKAPAKASAYMPEVYGSVVFSEDQEMAMPALYQIPTNNKDEYALIIDGADAQYGGVAVDGIYYTHYVFSFLGFDIPMVSAFDLATGEELAYWWSDGSEQAQDLAYNIKDGKVYGLFTGYEYDDEDNISGSYTYLGTITYPELDDEDGEPVIEQIAKLEGNWNALAIDNTGKIYAISMERASGNYAGEAITYTKNSYLYTIDPATGATTKVGTRATGLAAYYLSSATFDLATNRLFWAVSTKSYSIMGGIREEGALCEVNTTTGVATRLVTYPNAEEICGIYTPSMPVAEGAPDVATDIKTDFAVGSKTGTISFTLPTTLFDGTETSGKLGYYVTVNKTDVIATGEGNAGETITIDATFEMSGDKKIAVTVTNAAGESPAASISVYIGFAEAAAPEDVTLKEISNGVVEISWTPVTTDIKGSTLPEVTYTLVSIEGSSIKEILAQNISETTFTHTAVEAGAPQQLVEYAVFAEGEGGMGEPAFSNLIFAGEPYTEFRESFPDGSLSHDLIIEKISGSPSWGIYTDKTINIPDADNNNGMLGYTGSYINDCSSIVIGKINLAGMEAPVFSFFVYTIAADQTDEVIIYAGEPGTEFSEIYHMPINRISPVTGWHRVTVDLAAFAGKTIQLKIAALTQAYAYVFFDNLYVGTPIAKDFAATALDAPGKVKAGEDFTATVSVMNLGTESAAGTVNLYIDGEIAMSKETSALAPEASTAVEFTVPMHILATKALTLYAETVTENDGYEGNNKTLEVKVTPIVSTLPAVTDLKGNAAGKTVNLTWSEPESPETQSGLVDFEDAESFAQTYGDWTFVDVDGGMVGGFDGLDIPGIISGSPATFFVFDASGDDFNKSFAANSGDKYLAALWNFQQVQCNDWAISPELSGNAQTISFWAKSYSGSYPESFEVLYSTTDKTIASFKSISKQRSIPAEWTEYTADLPEGAKYFAVRYDATDTFMLMLDDFTFEAKPETPPTLTGFNIYRDGNKINTEPLDEGFYAEDLENGTYSYVVTALYDKGESKGSNVAEITVDDNSGIEAATSAITIEGADKAIVITGAEGLEVTISAVDGKTLFAGEATATLTVPVAQGIYIVKAGNTVAKIIVR